MGPVHRTPTSAWPELGWAAERCNCKQGSASDPAGSQLRISISASFTLYKFAPLYQSNGLSFATGHFFGEGRYHPELQSRHPRWLSGWRNRLRTVIRRGTCQINITEAPRTTRLESHQSGII